MEAPQTNSLPDIQSSGDPRNIRINRVGVRGVELPVTVADEADVQHTVARLTMSVALPPDHRGTHMSRFIGILEAQTEPYTIEVVQSTIRAMLAELQAQEGTFEIRFPFFLRKAAPISRLESVMNYECAWTATISPAAFELRQETITPVTSLCPCSKEISRYGAHNQRSRLTSSIVLASPMSLREQIALSEAAGSAPLWARLKRADEKFVTEYAYDNPKFVEDIVRDMAESLNKDSRVTAYRVESEILNRFTITLPMPGSNTISVQRPTDPPLHPQTSKETCLINKKTPFKTSSSEHSQLSMLRTLSHSSKTQRSDTRRCCLYRSDAACAPSEAKSPRNR